MKTNFNISESDKKDILDLHKIIKESLNSKRSKININEQASQLKGVELLNAAKNNSKCMLPFGGILKSAPGKPIVLYKIADYDSKNGYFVKGDELYIKDNFTFDVVKNENGVKKLSSQNKPWKCDALYQKENDVKKAEEEKKDKEQAGMTAEQKQFIDLLKGRGYVIDPLPSDIEEKQLERVALAKIPNLEKYFPNGLNVYSDPTIRSTTDVTDYTKRAGMMVGDVTKCKDIIEAYWEDYSGGGKGDPTDTLFLDAKNKAQACANKYYPKWNGLKSGVLGIASGQNHLNNIIDVLTGKEQSFKGVGIPSRTTGWGLTRPRRER